MQPLFQARVFAGDDDLLQGVGQERTGQAVVVVQEHFNDGQGGIVGQALAQDARERELACGAGVCGGKDGP